MAPKKQTVTVSVINMKGGVGKSTISALLSRYAASTLALDVLAVDLDPQANLSQSFMQHARYKAFLDDQSPSVVEIFNGYLPPTASKKSSSAIIADQAVVSVAGSSLQLIPSRFDFSDNLIGALKPDPKVLAKFLSQNFQEKDLIIIDCAPTESVLTQAAYHASGLVLVPVKPEYFATIGFPLLQQSLDQFRARNRAHRIEVTGVVINNAFYNGGNNGGPEKARALREIREEAGNNSWSIFKNEIPHSRGFPKKMRGDHSYSGNADRFDKFAKEFFDKIGFS